jgi:hypothetical protein
MYCAGCPAEPAPPVADTWKLLDAACAMCLSFAIRAVKFGEQFENLLRFKNYFVPRVPDGCFENIVTVAPGFAAFGIPSLRGCCTFAFAEPP